MDMFENVDSEVTMRWLYHHVLHCIMFTSVAHGPMVLLVVKVMIVMLL
jgi:hypothetical protein